MKPSVTFDAIFAALAVLSVGAGCSKADRAAAEPPAATPAASAPPATATAAATTKEMAPAAQPVAPAPAMASGAAVVDAGTERSIGKKPGDKGGNAACGATGCSAEMRKGGK